MGRSEAGVCILAVVACCGLYAVLTALGAVIALIQKIV